MTDRTSPLFRSDGCDTPRPQSGLFISFEGGDCSGKTTQIGRLRDSLTALGRRVVVTREPGGTELGNQLRQLILHGPDDVDPRCEALLYAADRAYHVATLVRPALVEGKVVIADRYFDSSVAYQGAARDLGRDRIRELSLWATDGLVPDVTFILDMDPALAAARRQGSADRLEREALDFHRRVRSEFLDIAAANPARCVVIDAAQDPDTVTAAIWQELQQRGLLQATYDDEAAQ